MKVVTIVGARPQFVKAAAISRVLRQSAEEILVHTGQHYDDRMSRVFFDQLGIPSPDHDLGVGSGGHGQQTGEMLQRLEPVLEQEAPDFVVVVGDTNSTLAGALTAAKLHIRVAHVEAGLRSFNRKMPEELNRILTDHLSTLLFCPSQTAVDNLSREGITRGVYDVGDVMVDALHFAVKQAAQDPAFFRRFGVEPGKYLLATVHRAENTDDGSRLTAILETFAAAGETVVFPIHPRTQKAISRLGLEMPSNVKQIEPVGYIEMAALEKNARLILTDSGGVQKEAYWLKVPCITLRDDTEWVETVESGWNYVAGVDTDRIVSLIRNFPIPDTHQSFYGDESAAQKLTSILMEWC